MNNEKMLQVRNFSRNFTHISKDELLPKAFWTLESTGDTHLVVIQDEKPIGIVSYKDFLHILADRVRRKQIHRLYVSSIMTTNLIGISETESIHTAAKMMIEKGISSLLVKRDDKIIGILTKKDILRKIDLFEFNNDEVESIMIKNPITAPRGLSITGAERLLKEKKISTLPIVEEGELVGYIDIHILARFMINLFLDPQHRHPETILHSATLGDIMKNPFYVFPNTTILTFSRKVLKRKYKGAPVVLSDANKRVVGIITETDIIKRIASM